MRVDNGVFRPAGLPQRWQRLVLAFSTIPLSSSSLAPGFVLGSLCEYIQMHVPQPCIKLHTERWQCITRLIVMVKQVNPTIRIRCRLLKQAWETCICIYSHKLLTFTDDNVELCCHLSFTRSWYQLFWKPENNKKPELAGRRWLAERSGELL